MLTRAAAAVTVAAAAWAASPAAAAPPEIADSWASNISAAAADLNALVNPRGLTTSGRMEYITAQDYEFNLKAGRDGFFGAAISPLTGTPLGSGSAPVEFIRPLGGLLPARQYIYRATAANADGTALGEPRSFTTTPKGGTAFALPDGRAWEMVSPLDKEGGEIQAPGEVLGGGGVFQAAADGGAVTYSSTGQFAGPQGNPGAGQYVSSRSAEGWSTRNVTRPSVGGGYGEAPDGVPFQRFSGDLARALVATPWNCEQPGCRRAFELLAPGSGDASESPARPDLRVVGANDDLGVVLLSTCAKLTPDATEVPGPDGCDPAAPNLYAWNGTSLALVNLLPGDDTGTPGSEVAAPGAGAVSADGASIYFRLGGVLYLRREGATVAVDAAIGGGATFEVAAADGSVAYLSKGGHLYRYEAGGSLADLTPAGGLLGVLGASPDGSHVYFLDGSGLRRWSGGTAATIAAGADPSNSPPATGTARVAADGTLAYLDSSPWPGSDNRGYSQVIVHRPSTGATICVSCNPTGARSLGPSVIPGAMANGSGPSASTSYKPRALTADGNRLFFESADPLVLGDTNAATDVYQWSAEGVGGCEREGGCVALLSSGLAVGGARFLDASADGEEVFFVTPRSLIRTDPGGADVYVAKVGGGIPIPDPPIPCLGDACQPVPGAPEDPLVATTALRPEGNAPLRVVRERPARRKAKKKMKKAHCAKQRRRGAKNKRGAAKRCGAKRQDGKRGARKARSARKGRR